MLSVFPINYLDFITGGCRKKGMNKGIEAMDETQKQINKERIIESVA